MCSFFFCLQERKVLDLISALPLAHTAATSKTYTISRQGKLMLRGHVDFGSYISEYGKVGSISRSVSSNLAARQLPHSPYSRGQTKWVLHRACFPSLLVPMMPIKRPLSRQNTRILQL